MLRNLFALNGKTAIVTGASYGLGVTFAEALAEAGANVVLSARSGAKLEDVARRPFCCSSLISFSLLSNNGCQA